MGQALRQEKYLESINYLDTLHGDSKGCIFSYCFSSLIAFGYNFFNPLIIVNLVLIM
jgi:hypothetical protein